MVPLSGAKIGAPDEMGGDAGRASAQRRVRDAIKSTTSTWRSKKTGPCSRSATKSSPIWARLTASTIRFSSAALYITGVYQIQNYAVDAFGIATNKANHGSLRGIGKAEARSLSNGWSISSRAN